MASRNIRSSPEAGNAAPDVFGQDLFGQDPAWPEGLRYQPAFITGGEERGLIEAFAALPLAPFQFGAFEGKRRVASFGVRYDFGDQRLHTAAPFPDFIKPLAARAETFAGLQCGAIRQVLCTEYATGAGIGWHRDKGAFDVVLGLSLGSACPFRFRRKAAARWQRFTLEAAPCSLYLMTGAARSLWEHSIAPVAAPRWSITFRTMAR
jgi:alkylated DNA repair dioxygenase AlkB